MFMEQVNIGEIIRHELRNRKLTASWLATRLCCTRTNIYKIFKRTSIDSELLLRISNAIGVDLFRHYTDQFTFPAGRRP